MSATMSNAGYGDLTFIVGSLVSASFISLLELESPWAGGKEMRFGGVGVAGKNESDPQVTIKTLRTH